VFDKSINISAVNLPYDYYLSKKGEDNLIAKLIFNIHKYKLDNNKFNLVFLHSPNGIMKDGNIDTSLGVISNSNLILCGHNHAGLVPTGMQDLLNNHKGFVGPYRTLFSRYSYGTFTNNDCSVLVSNGFTKISTSSELGKLSKIINKVYSPEVDVIDMEPGENIHLNLNLELNIKKYHFLFSDTFSFIYSFIISYM